MMTSIEKSILLISPMPPSDRQPSGIVLKRHLVRLHDDGFGIIVAYRSRARILADICDDWETIELPDRRRWWPPARYSVPFSMMMRVRALEMLMVSYLKQRRPAAVLTYLCSPIYNDLAVRIANRFDVPLIAFAHDDCRRWYPGNHSLRHMEWSIQKISKRVDRLYVVSERLARCFPLARQEAVCVLPPMPNGADGGCNGPIKEGAKTLTLAYAGSFYEGLEATLVPIARKLADIGGKLLVVTDPTSFRQASEIAREQNVEAHPPFATSEQARAFLKEHASAVLVAYPQNRPEWHASFPSKLVEFVHLRLPTVIIAPTDSAVGDWALENHWQGFADTSDSVAITRIIRDLRHPSSKATMIAQATRAAAEEFDPVAIHQQVCHDLSSLGVGIECVSTQ